MKLIEAQVEFAARYYLWAREEARLEVERGFPLLKRIDTSSCHRFFQRMSQLSLADRQIFAALLVKRFHQHAMKLFGENLSADEVAEIKRYTDGGCHQFDQVEEIFVQRQLDGDPNKKLNRKHFRKLLKGCLITTLGQEDAWGGDGTWRYNNTIENLRVETYLDTGGQFDQLCYSHRIIFSGYQTLVELTSVLFWLGISNQTCWQQLDDSKIEATAHLLSDVCAHFLDSMPKLLKGIAP